MKTVLILDDDDAVRESLADFFEDRGWRVLRAVSAEAALELLQSETPDGAVVDIRLPGMNGKTFIQRMSAFHPAVACVVVTGSPGYSDLDELADMDVVCKTVFNKPIANLSVLETALLGQMAELHRKQAGRE